MFGDIILFLLGMRDNLGIQINGIPFRFGEFAMLIYSFLYLRRFMRKPNSKSLSYILSFMILHLVSSIVSVICGDNSQVVYILKYLFRSVLVLLFLFVVNHTNTKRIKFNFDSCMKYLIIVFYVTLFLESIGYTIQMCKLEPYYGHKFMGIPRFSGTASEPGYFLEPLVLPFYYYYKKHDKKMFIATCILGVLTFSAAVYAGLLLVFFIDRIIDSRNKGKFIISKSILKKSFIFVALISICIVILNFTPYKSVIAMIYMKVTSFITGSKSADYSTMVRILIKDSAINEYRNGSFIQLLLGRGLGGFLSFSRGLFDSGKLFHYGESPDNVYLGIIFDTGIFGLISYLAILLIALKQKPKSVEARTIYCSLVISCLHNFIFSGMWLFSTWVEIGLLFLINKKDSFKYENKGNIEYILGDNKDGYNNQ